MPAPPVVVAEEALLSAASASCNFHTRVLPISLSDLGTFTHSVPNSFLHSWSLSLNASPSATALQAAAIQLRDGSPVAFPTETVYGLGADATSSRAVRSIYAAKRRPADNPLIVHVASLDQLRTLLDPRWTKRPRKARAMSPTTSPTAPFSDPIPDIYLSLIQRFWPGPLTILLPLPQPSPLAPEVTNSLPTFGARMPSSLLALALIQTTGKPLAAPSANASGKPSPTTAAHVVEDLAGRIGLVLDGGPCEVGVESTVVDGLCSPPCVLRPGGVGIEEIRKVPGWESAVNGYEGSERSHQELERKTQTNGAQAESPPEEQTTDAAPRAPGMKYRHYAPRAHVVLIDAAAWESRLPQLVADAAVEHKKKVGVLFTRSSAPAIDAMCSTLLADLPAADGNPDRAAVEQMRIGPSVSTIARSLFAALRHMDARGVDVIFVEGIESGDEGEAVMNRLRKAAGSRVLAKNGR